MKHETRSVECFKISMSSKINFYTIKSFSDIFLAYFGIGNSRYFFCVHPVRRNDFLHSALISYLHRPSIVNGWRDYSFKNQIKKYQWKAFRPSCHFCHFECHEICHFEFLISRPIVQNIISMFLSRCRIRFFHEWHRVRGNGQSMLEMNLQTKRRYRT